MDGALSPIEPLPEGMSLVKEWSWRGGVAKHYELSEDPLKQAQVGYYEDGKLRFYYPAIGDKYEGICKTWHPNGEVASEDFYHDGVQEGSCREWYSTGVLKSVTEFKKGCRHGFRRGWHENGIMMTESYYVNGSQEGAQRDWDSKGTLRDEMSYQKDRLHGVYKKWHENGNIECVRHYERGLWHGRRTEWYPDGKLKCEGNYRTGQIHGMKKEFDQEGKLISKEFFVAGISVGPQLTRVIEKDALNAGHILRAQNAAIRRACLEILGYARFLSQVTHKVLSKEGDSELIRVEWHKREEPIHLVKVKCPSTGAYYALRVPPGMKTIKEAVAWTFGEKESEYSPLEES